MDGTSSQAPELLGTPGWDRRVGQAVPERCCRRETLESSHCFLLKRRSKCRMAGRPDGTSNGAGQDSIPPTIDRGGHEN